MNANDSLTGSEPIHWWPKASRPACGVEGYDFSAPDDLAMVGNYVWLIRDRDLVTCQECLAAMATQPSNGTPQ